MKKNKNSATAMFLSIYCIFIFPAYAQSNDTSTTPNSIKSAEPIITMQSVFKVSAGSEHTCVLTSSGGVKCWGRNNYGQLGMGTKKGPETCKDYAEDKYPYSCSLAPVDVKGLSSGVTAIATAVDYTCALTTSGGVKCWGRSEGLWGGSRYGPVNVKGLSSGVTAIAAGGDFACALTTSGGVKCWGNNDMGQLGDGTKHEHYSPVNVKGLLSGTTAIATGNKFACAALSAGGVKCWGSNMYGVLGIGTISGPEKCQSDKDGYGDSYDLPCSTVPVDVTGISSRVKSLVAGQDALFPFACALTTSGGVKCWGNNDMGQLGNGTKGPQECTYEYHEYNIRYIHILERSITRPCSTTPVDVTGLPNDITAIAAGYLSACVLTSSGEVKCWKDKILDRRLKDTIELKYELTSIGIVDIDIKLRSTCVVFSDGTLKCIEK